MTDGIIHTVRNSWLRWVGTSPSAALVLLIVVSLAGLAWLWRGTSGSQPALAVGAAIVVVGLALISLGAFPEAPSSGNARWWLVLLGALLTVESVILLNASGQWTIFRPVVSVVPGPPLAQKEKSSRRAVILAVNDTYRVEPNRHDTLGGLARLRTLRAEHEMNGEPVLLLHGGDFLSPSLLSKSFSGEHMVAAMNLLDGRQGEFDPFMLVAFGNHEFDKADCDKPEPLRDRIRQSEFLWLSANIDFGACDKPLLTAFELRKVKPNTIVEIGGIRIGVFGLSIEASASGGKKPPPIRGEGDRHQLAQTLSRELRAKGAEVVVALTHLSWQDDLQIVNLADGPDFLIGGHDHEKMVRTAANGRSLYKADADGKTASVLHLTLGNDRQPDVVHRFVELGPAVAEDEQVKQEADRWLARFDREYEKENCGGTKGCLDHGIARTPVALQGDERRIRRTVTTLGTWITHEMLALAATCFRPDSDHTPTIAIINSGSLRLNGDIAGNAILTRRDVEEMLYYKTVLKVVDIRGAELLGVLQHSFSQRGDGGWLQLAGLQIVSGNPSSAAPNILEENGAPIDRSKTYRMAVTEFLLDPKNDDKFDLSRTDGVECPNDPSGTLDLKEWLMTVVATKPSIDVPPVSAVCGSDLNCGGDSPALRPAALPAR